MDLQIFPTYDGRQVQFVTAQPGEEGSSTITLQLSPITDRQVRETTKPPVGPAEVTIDEVDLDEEVKDDLRRVGVRSVEDLRRIEERNISYGALGVRPPRPGVEPRSPLAGASRAPASASSTQPPTARRPARPCATGQSRSRSRADGPAERAGRSSPFTGPRSRPPPPPDGSCWPWSIPPRRSRARRPSAA